MAISLFTWAIHLVSRYVFLEFKDFKDFKDFKYPMGSSWTSGLFSGAGLQLSRFLFLGKISALSTVLSLILTLTLSSLFALPAHADQLVTRITVNQEDKGDLFVNRVDNGDFLVKTEDLKNIGFRNPFGTVTRLEGEEYRSLKSMTGVNFTFDEGTLSLALSAPPSLLGKETVDFLAMQTQKVYYPEDSSVFLNYGADYQAARGLSSSSFTLTDQFGARKGNVLFLTDSLFSLDQSQDRFVRLQSSFTYDDRKELWRFIAGDFFAASDDLGSSLNMGGLSFAKVYRIDPYFINYPTLGLSGQVSLPSEAKVYLNGILMKTEHFSPGEFELKNITPYGSAGAVDVVLKDAFGREQRISYPFYFGGASLLKKGLQEYSYNLGFLRDQYGTESNRYSDLAFSAFHRFGVSDALTLGFRAEAKESLYNLGPQATVLLNHAGLLSLSLAGSTGGSAANGAAGTASYSYQGLRAGANASFSGYTRDYAIVAGNSAFVPKTQASGGLSYTDKLLGALSLGYSSTKVYQGQNSNVASAGYSRILPGGVTLTATYRHIKQADSANEIFVALNYSPKPDLSISASYQSSKGSRDELFEVQKNAPIGEGYGYRVNLDHSEAAGQSGTTLNPSLQYNGRYGIYQGEFTGQESAGHSYERYHLAASGALVYAGSTFGATRPVYDSFGLVKVGDLEGVKVLLNSQEIGSTDSTGKLFIPDLGAFYQNQVAIDSKQISIDYFLSSVSKVISPPLRSGSCIPFLAKKLQPITGSLKVRVAGVVKPVEYREMTLTVQGKQIVFPTGIGGAFDIDLSQSDEFKKLAEAEESGCASFVAGPSLFIKPGSYQATVDYQGKPRSFAVIIPNSTEQVIDLGEIIIDVAPEPEQKSVKAPPVPEPVVKAAAPTAPAPAVVKAAPVVPSAAIKPAAKVAVKAVEKPTEAPLVKTVPPKLLPDDLPIMEVNFRFGTAQLASYDDQAILTTAVRLLELFPYARLVVEGYADQMGSHEYNQALSKKRALAVAAGLKKLGVPADKIAKISWFGKRTLLCNSMEARCREQNRRVVIQLVEGP